ncbi:unnamed protein product [Trichogramma brassicae]|uniref:Uncharacterized protein n=1 Tax=Trichogramma brassicae TaxID=86971 RepID=A0A6H5IU00_9HYME|nr:unnamed protein product [Trichogramma brassicae]
MTTSRSRRHWPMGASAYGYRSTVRAGQETSIRAPLAVSLGALVAYPPTPSTRVLAMLRIYRSCVSRSAAAPRTTTTTTLSTKGTSNGSSSTRERLSRSPTRAVHSGTRSDSRERYNAYSTPFSHVYAAASRATLAWRTGPPRPRPIARSFRFFALFRDIFILCAEDLSRIAAPRSLAPTSAARSVRSDARLLLTTVCGQRRISAREVMANPRFFLRWHVTLVATRIGEASFELSLRSIAPEQQRLCAATRRATTTYAVYNICMRACRDPTAFQAPRPVLVPI